MRQELGFPDKIGDDGLFDKTTEWANYCWFVTHALRREAVTPTDCEQDAGF